MKRMRIFRGLLCLLIILELCACAKAQPTWQEQYDLGVRYLSEGNYEEAIIAFTAAIEIDSKQAAAYVGRGDAYVLSGDTEENLSAAKADYEKAIDLDKALAEAYLGLADVSVRKGEYEKAIEVLQTGLGNVSDDEAIVGKISEIETKLINKSVSKLISEDFLLQSELTIHKKPFYNLSIYDVRDLFGDNILEENLAKTCENGTCVFYNGQEYTANSHINTDKLGGFEYKYYWIMSPNEIMGPTPEFRNIRPADTIESALSRIGFTEAGIESILNNSNSHIALTDWVELPDRSMVQIECSYYPDAENAKIVTISWDNWQVEDKPQQVRLELDFTKRGYLCKIQCACTDDKGAYFYIST